jgi:hypothetical protein
MGRKQNSNWKNSQKRHHRSRKSKNNNKIYLSAGISGVLLIALLFFSSNYDIAIDEEKMQDVIPVDSIEETFGEIKESIPIKIEEKTSNGSPLSTDNCNFDIGIPEDRVARIAELERCLEDCSVYDFKKLSSAEVGKLSPEEQGAYHRNVEQMRSEKDRCNAHNQILQDEIRHHKVRIQNNYQK